MAVIILVLDVVDQEKPGAVVRFAGSGYAEGFELAIPLREFEFLGSPDQLFFVASGDRLGVRAGWIEGVR